MKECPIILNAEEVRAILEGRKTVTRRVMRVQPSDGYKFTEMSENWPSVAKFERGQTPIVEGFGWSTCPYGQPGDMLWVRETWSGDDEAIYYRATDNETCGPPWFPSIHMPRWASRLTLEVTGVRVERVQDITVEQAEAEGVTRSPGVSSWDPCGEFGKLWDSINAKRGFGWDKNPWVFVIELKRINK